MYHQIKMTKKVKSRPEIVNSKQPYKQHFTNNYKNNDKFQKSNNKTPFVLVIGDSMMKNINSYDLKQKCPEANFMVRALRGGKIKNIKNLIIDTLEDIKKPDLLCIHVSANDIGDGRSVETIVTDLENLITIVQRQGIIPVMSMVTIRNDKHGYKVRVVNERLRKLCVQYNVDYIEHENIKLEHLNPGGVHIVNKFNYLFSENLSNYFNYMLRKELYLQ